MEENIYTPPKSELETHDPSVDGRQLASRWSRLGACLLDALTVLPITLPLMYFTGGFEGAMNGVQPSMLYSLAITLAGVVWFLLIHGYFIVRDGQTLGKKALGIGIVTLDGKLAPISLLAARYGFYWLTPIIPIIGSILSLVNAVFIFSKTKRCLHDRIGGTKVVRVDS
jgi:uncharacterized RDD family membrane protein YckC